MLLKFFVGTGVLFLIGLCGWLILIILMQKPSAQGGMGAALGGGMAESAFGGEASNVLTRWTVCSVIAFFILTLVLSLCQIPRANEDLKAQELRPMALEEHEATPLTELPKEVKKEGKVAPEAVKMEAAAPSQEPLQAPATPTAETPKASS